MVAAEGRDGGARLPRPRDLHLDEAHRGEEPAKVGPVPEVLTVAKALVTRGTDQLADLLLEGVLEHKADRAPEELLKVGVKILLRRGHELVSVFHRGSSSPPWQGRFDWFRFEELPHFLQAGASSGLHNLRDGTALD
jgi:hypothetical protein